MNLYLYKNNYTENLQYTILSRGKIPTKNLYLKIFIKDVNNLILMIQSLETSK